MPPSSPPALTRKTLRQALRAWDRSDRLVLLLREWEATGDSAAAVDVPFTAPPALPHGLVGRATLLADLRRRLLDGASPARLALYGLPGVGKTSLAAALCHDPELQGRYSDGVLWAGLGPQPDPAVALHLWEIALGFTAEELSALPSAADRARALHAAIGARAMLLVLDDVREVESARLLEVGGPACAYIYTTRRVSVAKSLEGPGLAAELAEGGAVQVPELDSEAGLEVLGRLAPQLASELKSRGAELELARHTRYAEEAERRLRELDR